MDYDCGVTHTSLTLPSCQITFLQVSDLEMGQLTDGPSGYHLSGFACHIPQFNVCHYLKAPHGL